MKKKDSGGIRLFDFRQGDRSEYLAIWALTRIAFVTPVPRQEDFGVVDFKCVLGKDVEYLSGKRQIREVHPKGTFSLQVKSSGTKKLNLNARQIEWISTNMDCPLFICVVDRKAAKIKLFSCVNIWSALFLRMHPQKITLVLGKHGPSGEPYVHHPGHSGHRAVDVEGTFDVFLGPPVIDIGISEFEEQADLMFSILNMWIKLDRFNVALMRFGRAATVEFESWRANEVPRAAKWQRTFHRPVNQHGLLDKICPLLESLRLSYERFGPNERASKIASLLRSFEQDRVNSKGDPLERLLE